MRCAVCSDTGCEFCASVDESLAFSEPFDRDAFTMFTDADLVQLVKDAQDVLTCRRVSSALLATVGL